MRQDYIMAWAPWHVCSPVVAVVPDLKYALLLHGGVRVDPDDADEWCWMHMQALAACLQQHST
jgi:hypothetical protein